MLAPAGAKGCPPRPFRTATGRLANAVVDCAAPARLQQAELLGALLGKRAALNRRPEALPGRESLRGDRYRLATAQCERGSTPTRAEEVVWQCQTSSPDAECSAATPRLRARAAEEVW